MTHGIDGWFPTMMLQIQQQKRQTVSILFPTNLLILAIITKATILVDVSRRIILRYRLLHLVGVACCYFLLFVVDPGDIYLLIDGIAGASRRVSK
jgi:hypothetical protein